MKNINSILTSKVFQYSKTDFKHFLQHIAMLLLTKPSGLIRRKRLAEQEISAEEAVPPVINRRINRNHFSKLARVVEVKKIKTMSNLRNSVQLIGRLGKAPEVKQLESGRFVANVSIATNDIYKNTKGEKVIETQWHNLVFWGKNAENVQKICAKGDELAIQGKLTHRSYDDKEGVTRYVTEIVVNEFVKLSRVLTANVA